MNKTEYYDELQGINLYVLELQNGKYYVGITHNPKERINNHIKGKTNDFIRPNLPFIRFEMELLETTDRKEAINIETELTIDFINHFGIENIAGGRIVGDLKRRRRIFKNELQKRLM